MNQAPRTNTGTGGCHFEVYCPVQTSLLSVLRRFISCVAEDVGFSSDDVNKIEMAVDEACTNVASHAYRDEAAGRAGSGGIRLKILFEPSSLTIHIEDQGGGAQFDSARTPDTIEKYQRPDRGEYHGLGILIMKEFMDEVRLTSDPEQGTVVTLRKFVAPAAEQP